MAQAETGNHVRVTLTGRLDDGTIFATSINDEPIEFTMGDNEVLPAIEEAVEGKNAGMRFLPFLVSLVFVPGNDASTRRVITAAA